MISRTDGGGCAGDGLRWVPGGDSKAFPLRRDPLSRSWVVRGGAGRWRGQLLSAPTHAPSRCGLQPPCSAPPCASPPALSATQPTRGSHPDPDPGPQTHRARSPRTSRTAGHRRAHNPRVTLTCSQLHRAHPLVPRTPSPTYPSSPHVHSPCRSGNPHSLGKHPTCDQDCCPTYPHFTAHSQPVLFQ